MEKARQDSSAANESLLPKATKRPYRSPEFKRLGAVADLTLGSANTTAEARGGKLTGTSG